MTRCVWRSDRLAAAAAVLFGIAVADAMIESIALAGDGAKAAESSTGSLQPPSTAPSAAATVRVRPSQMLQLKVVNVQAASFGMHRDAIGQIAFNEDASTVIHSPFAGRVTRLIAKQGDVIARGSALFEIDSPEVVQAQTDLIGAVQGLAKARSLLTQAQRTLARQSELLAGRATSVREHDQARSDVSTAEAEVKTFEGTLLAARNKLRVLVGRTDEEIQRVERDRLIDPRYVVTSPIAGTIVSRKVGPGQFVRSDAQEPLFTISDLSVMWLRASVPENEVGDMKVGQEVEVRVAAIPDEVFTARVTAIGAASDTVTRRITVRSELPNPKGLLRAEMFATFRIKTGATPNGPVVPLESVIREGESASVWVEREPMLFERRAVQLGRSSGNRIQILSGLQVGEKVVGRGAIFVDNEWRQ